MIDDLEFVTQDIITKTKTDLEKLLYEPRFNGFHNDYCFNAKIAKQAILFLGINPSNSKMKDELPIVQANKNVTTYTLEQNEVSHPYFAKFLEISQETNTPWTHLDLLFYAETNQKKGEALVKVENGSAYLNEQLKLAKRLIDAANPKVMVVNNTFARTLMGYDKHKGKDGKEYGVWLDYDFNWDENIGTYRANGIPTFLSSMLTGGRALDRGSYKRLKWHIKKVLSGELK